MRASGSSEQRLHDAIAAYYDYTTPFYRLFWHGDTAALHFGLAARSTRSAGDELLQTNRFLARVGGIDRFTRVVDAGCGIGGSAIWLASHFGAQVTGLTLSSRQAARARREIRRRGVADLVDVRVADYLDSGIADASVDVVWAIESVCYADDKAEFLGEAFRILRPGGRLVLADGLLTREPESSAERGRLGTFLEGLVLPGLASRDDLVAGMREAGFTACRYWDQTSAVLPSSQRLRRRCAAGLPLALAGQALGLTPKLLTENLRAGIVQWSLVRSGLISYSVLRGEKPRPDQGFVADRIR